MNYPLRRLLSLIIAVFIAFSAFVGSASAAAYVTGANSASASYKAGVYYSNLSAITLTGDGRLDVIAIALSQLGYQEGDSDGEYSGTVSGSNNYTEFNRNMGSFGYGYGGSSYPWCASFVSFCLLQSGCTTQNSISDWCRNNVGNINYIWREVSCSQWAAQLRRFGYFKNRGSYTPQAADLIFFTSNGSTESHIGLVLYVKDGRVYTIEGNTSSGTTLVTNGGGVYFKSYALTSTYIVGYGTLPYRTDPSASRIDYSGATPSAGLYVATTNKYVYENEGDTSYKWLLPKFTMFEVTGVASNGRLISKCTIGGQEVNGFIKNNTDRVIQLTTAPEPTEEPDNNGNQDNDNPSDSGNTGDNFGGGNNGDGNIDDNTGNTGDGNGGDIGNDNAVTVSSIELTAKPRKLYYLIGEDLKLDGLKITASYSDGSSLMVNDYTVSGFDSSDSGKKTVSISYGGHTVSFNVNISKQVSASKAFPDVLEAAWYTDSLDYALSYKMIGGHENGTFDPDGTITRAQFVQLLANISDAPLDSTNDDTIFTDVRSGSWYVPAIKWAADMHIVGGRGDGTFGPDDPVTREEMCVMIINYTQNYLDIALDPVCEKISFVDEAQISDWAYEKVYICQTAGLVHGVGEGMFLPSATANRASAAKLFVNFHEQYIK